MYKFSGLMILVKNRIYKQRDCQETKHKYSYHFNQGLILSKSTPSFFDFK